MKTGNRANEAKASAVREGITLRSRCDHIWSLALKCRTGRNHVNVMQARTADLAREQGTNDAAVVVRSYKTGRTEPDTWFESGRPMDAAWQVSSFAATENSRVLVSIRLRMAAIRA